MDDTTDQVLTERIQEQERIISNLRERLQAAEENSADYVVRRLRLHGTILLHVAGDMPKYESSVRAEGLERMGEDLISQTWDLDSAPLADDVKAAVKSACNNGLYRW
ncbi:hypothetical protein [Leisingera sp. ANG59]|uniref:hypothetical protein n=1 Tax=Leisingera sp. ANG59 TaxID=2675221 RepID=UPI0015728C76|nr:hypothetical protein [Leisingera sp. ANG59]NSY40704.1 hypothetical protein [Leisingera sp. ANG59]